MTSPPPILPYITDKHARTRKITLAFLWSCYTIALGECLLSGAQMRHDLSRPLPRTESTLFDKIFAAGYLLFIPFLFYVQWRMAHKPRKRPIDPTSLYIVTQMNRATFPAIVATQSLHIVDHQFQWAWITLGILATCSIVLAFPRRSKLWPPEGPQFESGHFD